MYTIDCLINFCCKYRLEIKNDFLLLRQVSKFTTLLLSLKFCNRRVLSSLLVLSLFWSSNRNFERRKQIIVVCNETIVKLTNSSVFEQIEYFNLTSLVNFYALSYRTNFSFVEVSMSLDNELWKIIESEARWASSDIVLFN